MSDKPKHQRSAGGIIVNPHNEVVLVSQNGTSWSFPKGRVEKGETDSQAAKREIFEESGLSEPTLIRPIGEYTRTKLSFDGVVIPDQLITLTLFLIHSDKHPLHPQDPDNPEARWVPIDQVSELLTHSHDKQFFEGIKQQLRR